MKSNYPKCPHCGTELKSEDVWYGDFDISTEDGDRSKVVCPNADCKKTYHTECVYDISFIQVNEDGDEL